MSDQSDLTRVCGLWRGKSKSGTDYLSGKLAAGAIEALAGARAGDRLMVFRNRNRRDDRDPEYTVSLAPAAPPANGTVHRPAPARAASPPAPRPADPALEITDDDIPF